MLCHFHNVDAEGEARYEMQFDILRKAYDNKWLIPSLASRVAYIADHHPEMQDSINAMFPWHQGLQDAQGLDSVLYCHVFYLINIMNKSKVDALNIIHARLGLEGSSEQDVLDTILAQRNDRNAVLSAIKSGQSVLQYASYDALLAMMKLDNSVLQYASRSAVLAVVTQIDGRALEYASLELRDDPAVVLAAFAQDKSTLAVHAGRNAVVLATVAQDGGAFQLVSEALRADREVVLAACGARLAGIGACQP